MVDSIKFATDYSDSIFIAKRTLSAPYRLHTHDYTELTIVSRGSARQTLNGQELISKPGDVFILKPHVIHGFPEVRDFEHYVFSYKPGMLDMVGADLRRAVSYQQLFALGHQQANRDYDAMFSLSLSALGGVVKLIESMLKELKHRPTGYNSVVQSRFVELIAVLCREYEQQSERRQPPLDVERAATLASTLENNYQNPAPMSGVAEHMGISERQLRRIFRNQYGMSPMEYLMQVRINQAAGLLRNTGRTMADIAYLCGFYDSNYFSHQFKKTTGVTPRAWRKQTSAVSPDSYGRAIRHLERPS